MRVLIGLHELVGFGGTETYALTVATELERLGHEAVLHARVRGPMAEAARDRGFSVVGPDELPRGCDLVLVNDVAVCHELCGRYDAPLVFVTHSADFTHQLPPQTADACVAIVAMNDRVRAALEAREWAAPIVRLRQPLSTSAYRMFGVGDSRARAALVSTNYLRGTRARMIENACRAAGLRTVWIGATSRPTSTPELLYSDVDAVIGLGRTVLEGMAAGKPAYVYGQVGGDGWVTPERYPAMEADGFAGTADPGTILDVEQIATDLDECTPELGELGRDLATAHHRGRDHAIALIALARGERIGEGGPLTAGEEMARLVRLQWRSDARAVGYLAEVERLQHHATEIQREAQAARAADAELIAHRGAQVAELRARIATLESELDDARHYVAAADAETQRIRSSARYRLGQGLAYPMDRLRRERASEG